MWEWVNNRPRRAQDGQLELERWVAANPGGVQAFIDRYRLLPQGLSD